jgi:DNA-binding NtrC family response regulator
MKVLLVEDNSDDRQILTHLLKGSEIQLFYASTLTEALMALEKENFDCVLADPGLTDCLPSETIPTIMRVNPNATAIAYSGNTDPLTMAEAIKAGAHAWLRKGTDDRRAEDILRVIRDAVTRCKSKSAC